MQGKGEAAEARGKSTDQQAADQAAATSELATATTSEPDVDALAALLPALFGAIEATGKGRGEDPPGLGPDDATLVQAELALTLLAAPVAATVAQATASARTAGDAPTAAAMPPAIVAAAPGTGSAETTETRAPTGEAVSARGKGAVPEAPGRLVRESVAAGQQPATDPVKLEREAARSQPVGEAKEMHAPPPLPEQAMVPMHAAAAARHAAADTLYRITPALGSRQWESAVGNSLVFMTGQQQSSAELVLTPPQFGRIEISLTVNADNTATATFVSASPAVQEALTNALPRLKEILADAGITLSQADVNAGSPEQSPGGNGETSRRSATPDLGGDDATRAVAGMAAPMRLVRGVVDVFA
jgi:flagellar hook-length control protein FliK